MTDEKPNLFGDLFSSIKVPADLTKNAFDPSSKQIGESLGDLFFIAFSPITKARMKKQAEIQKFKEEIENELSKIPTEKLVEPPLNIVGPALEASKYYIEHEEIRHMFAKLISSATNLEKTDGTHSAFIEIIKQLSPLDAKLFNYLYQNKKSIVGGELISRKLDDSGDNTIIRRFFPFPEVTLENVDTYTASIDNLIRLGLIEMEVGRFYTVESRYDVVYNHPIYLSLKSKFETENQSLPENLQREVHLRRSIWNVTAFGNNFGVSCL